MLGEVGRLDELQFRGLNHSVPTPFLVVLSVLVLKYPIFRITPPSDRSNKSS